jgi:hypothetical protein
MSNYQGGGDRPPRPRRPCSRRRDEGFDSPARRNGPDEEDAEFRFTGARPRESSPHYDSE